MYLNRTFMFYIIDIITFKNMKKVINRIIILYPFSPIEKNFYLTTYHTLLAKTFRFLLLL